MLFRPKMQLASYNRIMKKVTWLGFVVILVIIFGTIYAAVQQSQRSDADFPQVQVAEDTAAALDAGTKPAGLTSGHIDMASSLAPFTIIYSKNGRVISGNGYLDGNVAVAPFGILQAANGKLYHSVTWQPQHDVRIAVVTVSANGYYVLSGRSLVEVEKNETKTLWLSFAGGVASLIVLAGTYIATEKGRQ